MASPDTRPEPRPMFCRGERRPSPRVRPRSSWSQRGERPVHPRLGHVPRRRVYIGVTSLSSDFALRTGPIVQVGQASTFADAIGNIGGAPVRGFAGPQILS